MSFQNYVKCSKPTTQPIDHVVSKCYKTARAITRQKIARLPISDTSASDLLRASQLITHLNSRPHSSQFSFMLSPYLLYFLVTDARSTKSVFKRSSCCALLRFLLHSASSSLLSPPQSSSLLLFIVLVQIN